jgi:hypothetical protein
MDVRFMFRTTTAVHTGCFTRNDPFRVVASHRRVLIVLKNATTCEGAPLILQSQLLYLAGPKTHPLRLKTMHSPAISAAMAQDLEEPANAGDCLEAVCYLLDQAVTSNDQEYVDEPLVSYDIASTKLLSAFQNSHAGFLPSYYLRRISRYTGASPCCYVAMLLYLDRLQTRFPSMILTSWNLQRLLIIAVMTATKYLEDVCCRNKRW